MATLNKKQQAAYARQMELLGTEVGQVRCRVAAGLITEQDRASVLMQLLWIERQLKEGGAEVQAHLNGWATQYDPNSRQSVAG